MIDRTSLLGLANAEEKALHLYRFTRESVAYSGMLPVGFEVSSLEPYTGCELPEMENLINAVLGKSDDFMYLYSFGQLNYMTGQKPSHDDSDYVPVPYLAKSVIRRVIYSLFNPDFGYKRKIFDVKDYMISLCTHFLPKGTWEKVLEDRMDAALKAGIIDDYGVLGELTPDCYVEICTTEVHDARVCLVKKQIRFIDILDDYLTGGILEAITFKNAIESAM